MSWPLLGDDADSPLRSTVFAQDASVLDLPPMSAKSDKQSTPQTGDKTQFFDCTTSSFELSPLQSKSIVTQPTNSTRLEQPTRNLFEAQNEHTKALVEEVKLYRDLASRLHAEVVERDSVLADLNGRVLDTEVLRSQVGDLRDEVEKLRASSPKSESREMSASPLAAKSAQSHAGDRTTVVQAETRDLEIRLSKALSDHEMLQKQMDEVRHQVQTKDQELEETRRALSELEDRHRDHLISSRQSPPPADTRELEEATERCADLEFELTRATDLAQDLKDQMEDMRQVKASDEEEIDRLNTAVEGSRDSKRSEDDMRLRLEEMERRVDAEMRRREDMETRVQEEKDARKRLEVENREVSPISPLP
jgi:DNA repair exonuclease SbcCD ATPase subunit